MAAEILIVEDTESLALLYQNYLILTGAETVVVGTAQAAKAEIESSKYDLVLLDIMLPDANGIDVLDWINNRADKPQVIVVTAHGTKELV